MPDAYKGCFNEFQSTRPLRGATKHSVVGAHDAIISIHAPLTGRDIIVICYLIGMIVFQSTRPLRGATHRDLLSDRYDRISIHAPLTGRDALLAVSDVPVVCISIHAPLTGRDYRPPVPSGLRKHFNPRAPYGARPARYVQSHNASKFQSTRPLRGATRQPLRAADHCVISIHAPLTGRDCSLTNSLFRKDNFNPRAPYGARHVDGLRQLLRNGAFQSTRPLRGATMRLAQN